MEYGPDYSHYEAWHAIQYMIHSTSGPLARFTVWAGAGRESYYACATLIVTLYVRLGSGPAAKEYPLYERTDVCPHCRFHCQHR